MKKLIFAATMLILSFTSFSQTSTYVNGYTRSNGTYVSGYYRTTADYTKDNNYSTIGNVNPYTGSFGTKQGGLNPSYFSSSNYSTPSYPTTIVLPSLSTYDYSGYSSPSLSTYDYSGYSLPSLNTYDYSGYYTPSTISYDYSGYSIY